MAVLRFLASLFALIAVVALVTDATPALTGTGHFKATSVRRLLARTSHPRPC